MHKHKWDVVELLGHGNCVSKCKCGKTRVTESCSIGLGREVKVVFRHYYPAPQKNVEGRKTSYNTQSKFTS